MTTLVECPCCHGATFLVEHDAAGRPLAEPTCCHCIDGKVAAEVSKFDDAEQVLRKFIDWITAKRKATQ